MATSLPSTGASRTGAADPYLVALLFAVFGTSAWALKAASILFALGAALLTWRIVRQLVADPALAVLAGAAVWAFPKFYVYTSTLEYGFRGLTRNGLRARARAPGTEDPTRRSPVTGVRRFGSFGRRPRLVELTGDRLLRGPGRSSVLPGVGRGSGLRPGTALVEVRWWRELRPSSDRFPGCGQARIAVGLVAARRLRRPSGIARVRRSS